MKEAFAKITDVSAKNLFGQLQFADVFVPEICEKPIRTAHVVYNVSNSNILRYPQNGNGISIENGRSGNQGKEVVCLSRIVILLVHGFDSSFLEFRKVIPSILNVLEGMNLDGMEVEIRCVDIFGSGFTEKPIGVRYSIVEKRLHMLQYIQQVIYGSSKKDESRLVAVGCSLGAGTVVDLALYDPLLFDRMVLIDAELIRVRKATRRSGLQRWGVRLLESYLLRRLAIQLAFYDSALRTKENVAIGKLHCYGEGWTEAMIETLCEDGYKIGDELEKLDGQKVCIIWGRNDRIIEPNIGEMVHEKIKGSTMLWIDECGHVPHIEKPYEVARMILDFVSKDKGRIPESADELSAAETR